MACFSCPHNNCPRQYRRPDELVRHAAEHSPAFRCDCRPGVVFGRADQYKTHVQRCGCALKTEHACPFCGAVVPSSQVVAHVVTHGPPLFECGNDGCTESFHAYADLSKHLALHTAKRQRLHEPPPLQQSSNRKLLAFCLFKAKPSKFNSSFDTYVDTLLRSLRLLDQGLLRSWDVAVYVDDTVPGKALQTLLRARTTGIVNLRNARLPGDAAHEQKAFVLSRYLAWRDFAESHHVIAVLDADNLLRGTLSGLLQQFAATDQPRPVLRGVLHDYQRTTTTDANAPLLGGLVALKGEALRLIATTIKTDMQRFCSAHTTFPYGIDHQFLAECVFARLRHTMAFQTVHIAGAEAPPPPLPAEWQVDDDEIVDERLFTAEELFRANS